MEQRQQLTVLRIAYSVFLKVQSICKSVLVSIPVLGKLVLNLDFCSISKLSIPIDELFGKLNAIFQKQFTICSYFANMLQKVSKVCDYTKEIEYLLKFSIKCIRIQVNFVTNSEF
jgi:hypothetical protein